MRRLEQVLTVIVNAFAVLASILLIVVMLATVLKVALRGSELGASLIGVDQLSGTAMVYMTFLGAVWVLRKDGHVAVDLLLTGLASRNRRIVIVFHSLVGAVVCFAVSWYGLHAVQVSIARGVVVAAELEIPRAIGLIPIPIGAFLLGLEFLRRSLAAARGGFDSAGPLRQEA